MTDKRSGRDGDLRCHEMSCFVMIRDFRERGPAVFHRQLNRSGQSCENIAKWTVRSSRAASTVRLSRHKRAAPDPDPGQASGAIRVGQGVSGNVMFRVRHRASPSPVTPTATLCRACPERVEGFAERRNLAAGPRHFASFSGPAGIPPLAVLSRDDGMGFRTCHEIMFRQQKFPIAGLFGHEAYN